jgi:hypothetical protein
MDSQAEVQEKVANKQEELIDELIGECKSGSAGEEILGRRCLSARRV